VETLADLPGYPDNVRPDGKGGFWVALHRVGADGKSVRPTEIVERDGGKLYVVSA
jgi:hypothetical protein